MEVLGVVVELRKVSPDLNSFHHLKIHLESLRNKEQTLRLLLKVTLEEKHLSDI